MALVQACSHSSDLDVERGSDTAVIEIRVVAKEENEALTIWQRREDGGETAFGELERRIIDMVARIGNRNLLAELLASRRIHYAGPNPALETSFATVAAPMLDGSAESLLNGVARGIEIARDRLSDPEEAVEPLPVEVGEVVDRRCHISCDRL